MFDEKKKLIQNLTGVNSSKINYYIELKKRNKEIVTQNNRLEILHQLVHDINIDMSIDEIIKRVYVKLPLVLPCDVLGLGLVRRGQLRIVAMMPRILYGSRPVTRESILWECIDSEKAHIYNPVDVEDVFFEENPALEGQVNALAVIPLFCRTRVGGVLIVGSKSLLAYPPPELNFINQLADQLAIAIQNISLYEQVNRAKNEWEATFKAVTEPILMIDNEYNILRSNDHLPENMNHDSKNGNSEKCYQKLWGWPEKCPECPMEEAIKNGKPVYRSVQLDSGIIFDIYYYPVYNQNNHITGAILHMKDVTEKTKMEAQLVQSAKLAAIGEMAAGVAHELNNPMTVIIGTAQMMLRETKEDGIATEWLKDIINSGLRCRKIVQNLLTFSRQDQYPLVPTDLNDVVGRVLSLIQYQINKNKITITQNLSSALPKIVANGQQLQQVLVNFLLNARDALEGVDREGNIEVNTWLREGKDGEKQVVVCVKDNGEGIAEENLAKIFNPFYTSKESTKGTGLGLSVSLGIAEAHGGFIEVDSKPGKGSRFSLVLPVEKE